MGAHSVTYCGQTATGECKPLYNDTRARSAPCVHKKKKKHISILMLLYSLLAPAEMPSPNSQFDFYGLVRGFSDELYSSKLYYFLCGNISFLLGKFSWLASRSCCGGRQRTINIHQKCPVLWSLTIVLINIRPKFRIILLFL